MITETNLIAEPNSKESEMIVLGCMLTNLNSLEVASESLTESDFYFVEHKILFQSLKKFHKNSKPTDAHLVCEDLKTNDKLNSVGGSTYVFTLAQYACTSAYIEEYIEVIRDKSLLREIIHASQEIEKQALGNPENASYLVEKLSIKVKSLESRQGKKIPIISSSERLRKEEGFLKKYRGAKYLGLRVKTIEEFNENFLGLRGLMLLAAAPNVGKTALTVQTAVEVLSTEKNACLAYISLEMSEEQIFRRMLLNLSGLNFNSFVFGTQAQQIMDKEGRPAFFTQEEIEKIKEAEKTLQEFGERLQIIDQGTCPYVDAKTIINYVEMLKQKTGCSRAIVIIDYLQVWPTNVNLKLHSENEADKWRIGEMKKIRDAMGEDPVIVISEARKPSQNEEEWGGDLSDVMGSARGTYTPDVVMLFSQLQPKALKKLWDSKRMPSIPVDPEHESMDKNEKEGAAIVSLLAKEGLSICKIKTPKCRDGMKRFSTLLTFHFNKNKFTYVNWNEIKQLADKANCKG